MRGGVRAHTLTVVISRSERVDLILPRVPFRPIELQPLDQCFGCSQLRGCGGTGACLGGALFSVAFSGGGGGVAGVLGAVGFVSLLRR
jgi:hypothetical protein